MFWNRKKREDDLERELQNHLDLEAEEQLGSQTTPDEAGYAAMRTLGSKAAIRESTRETWGFHWLDLLI